MIKRGRPLIPVISLACLFLFPLLTWPKAVERFLPLPLIEVEQILSQWLFDSGFKVLREEKEGSEVLLRGFKENEVWEVILQPHSPLASRVKPRYLINGQSSPDKVAILWNFLDGYLKESQTETMTFFEEVPYKIKSKMETIACIKVQQGQEEIQFTGFGIDPKGIILSTAHDLRGMHEVMVFFNDGKAIKGALIKIDLQRDLSLIDVRSRLNASVSLVKGRKHLQKGERVFAIGCPNHARSFLSGTIEGDLRQVNNLPLYQTEMEIRPGSSGSPVFDVEGNLVGVVKGRYRGLSSRGFLIPLTTILEFLKEK